MRPRMIVSVRATALVATLGPTPRAGAATGEVTPVRSVDLTRYQGPWLRLAAIPQPFQAACARDEYTPLPDGLVRVTAQEGGAPAPVDLCGPSPVAATTGRG
ncbi:hypothetical protein SUDANB95_01926 [Actinosynnema sp. ALI-1.44]